MSEQNKNPECESLTLRSELVEVARVPPWVEKIVARHALPERTQFAMDLCLEEAISNVIRHGYSGESNHEINVRCENRPPDSITLIVEDGAPPFNPLLVPAPRVADSVNEMAVGGQGIHLVRQFADAVEYERLPSGNRLVLHFSRSSASSGAVS